MATVNCPLNRVNCWGWKFFWKKRKGRGDKREKSLGSRQFHDWNKTFGGATVVCYNISLAQLLVRVRAVFFVQSLLSLEVIGDWRERREEREFTWNGRTEDGAQNGRFVDATRTPRLLLGGCGRSAGGRQRCKSFGHHRCFGTSSLRRARYRAAPAANWCGQRQRAGPSWGDSIVRQNWLRHCTRPTFFLFIHAL